MARDNDAAQTTIVTGSAEEVEARIAAITANGGTLINVRVLSQPDANGKFEVEITHT